MCQLIETIRVTNGITENLNYHQDRMNDSFLNVFSSSRSFNLEEYLSKIKMPNDGIYKCRVHYDEQNIEHQISKYEFPKIKSLKMVFDDSIDYTYKYADRNELEILFSMREQCDDILIIKNGFVTDSYFANVVFYDGKHYFTPRYPLLKGTKRAKYLCEGIIIEAYISVGDLINYKYAKLINAMIDIEDLPKIDIDKII